MSQTRSPSLLSFALGNKSAVPDVIKRKKKLSELTNEEKDCLRLLHGTGGDYDLHRVGIGQRAPGTCEWFLDHPKFRGWESGQTSSLLWVTANPGCGKSVLSGFLADNLHQRLPDTFICSFFFKGGETKRTQSSEALCAVLHQILTAHPEALGVVMEHYVTKDAISMTQNVETLWDLVCSTVEEIKPRQVIIILDALDECVEQSRNRLAKVLKTKFDNAGGTQNGATKMKVLITSRPLAVIEDQFRSLLTIRLRAENETSTLSGELEKVIHFKVEQLKNEGTISNAAANLLETSLSQSADLTFLWISLVFETIAALPSRKLSAIKTVLNKLPKELDGLYESALFHFENPTASVKLLEIILAARRPLFVEELDVAMNLTSEINTFQELGEELETGTGAERFIKRLGGFFIRVIDSTVTLVHFTAREFLLNEKLKHIFHQSRSAPSLSRGHATLAVATTQFLVLDDMPQRADIPSGELLRVQSNETFEAGLPASARRFYVYAASHWPDHVMSLRSERNIDLVDRTKLLCSTKKSHFSSWWYYYASGSFFSSPGTGFRDGCVGKYYAHHAASRYDQVVTKGLIESGSCSVDDLNASGMDLLTIASKTDNTMLIDWLLQSFPHPEPRRGTALLHALSGNYESAARRLIDSGLDVNGRYLYNLDRGILAPVQRAVLHPEAVQVLLDNGLVIHDETIQDAAQHGYYKSLALLLEKDPRPLDERLLGIQHALVIATNGGWPRSRKAILERFSSCVSRDQDLVPGLCETVRRMDIESFKEMMAMGAQDRDGMDALLAACSMAHPDVIRSLLASKQYSQEQIDRALQEYFNTYIDKGLTDYVLKSLGRVLVSGYRGNARVAEMFKLKSTFGPDKGAGPQILHHLLDAGATTSTRIYVQALIGVVPMDEELGIYFLDNIRRFLPTKALAIQDFLTFACLWGAEAVVRFIIETGVDIDRSDSFGIRPLWAAVVSGNQHLVRCLLEHGADKEGISALSWPSDELFAEDAVHDALRPVWQHPFVLPGGPGKQQTALFAAETLGYADIIKLLKH